MINIILGDLNYFNEYSRSSLFVPLHIGLITSYLKKKFGSEVNISLFKDPQKLLDHTKSEKTDIIALSFYYWNTSLNLAVTKKIRYKFGKDVVIVWGGPSVDSDPGEQSRIFRRFPEVNAFTASPSFRNSDIPNNLFLA